MLKTKNLQPNEVIYVGDENWDIVACNKSNVKVIWVEGGYDGRDVIKSANPYYIVQKPEGILDLI